MKTSQTGMNLIKQFEGCKLSAYRCPAGVWTIGYGHTENVQTGMVISHETADDFLRSDLTKYEAKVNKYSQYSWRQNEFDALVSFAYNIGSIDQLTANGFRSRAVIGDKILLYNKAAGKVLEGLTRRRKAEQALFLGTANSLVEPIQQFSLKKDGEKQISMHFKVREFRCKDGSDPILIDTEFVRTKLQGIRDFFGMPVTINSAYRTGAYNSKVGGAVKSYHLTGQAFDIMIKDTAPQEVARYAQKIGVPGIIQYNTFVHVDSRNVAYYARDNGAIVTKVKSF